LQKQQERISGRIHENTGRWIMRCHEALIGRVERRGQDDPLNGVCGGIGVFGGEPQGLQGEIGQLCHGGVDRREWRDALGCRSIQRLIRAAGRWKW
jgi:hypothetical protein